MNFKAFDYKGFSEKEIKKYCNSSASLPFQNPYLGTEMYSLGALIRKFAFFPPFLPLKICYDHGLTLNETILDEQKENCKTRFVFAKWREEVYKPFYKNVKTILFPYIFYRKYKKIKQVKNPKGTLIFVAHDYAQNKEGYDKTKNDKEIVQKYIEKIKALPDCYKPVCACLHINDIRYSEIYKEYIKAGIPVYTAGSERDIRFVKRYYNILKNFKYAMAPALGSAALYAVDLNIPFTILKSRQESFEGYENIAKIFDNDPFLAPPKITPAQLDFVSKNTGINDSISRLEACKIVWSHYLKYTFKGFLRLFKISSWIALIEYMKL